MTRAKVDFYAKGQDAVDDALALREVGIGSRSVAAVWSCTDNGDAATPWGQEVGDRFVTEFGTIKVMGWLANTSGRPSSDWSAEIVRMLDCDNAAPDLRAKIETVLRSGGGMVAVRSHDEVAT